ncbi:MAG: hypothetical protein ACLQVF_32075 [Isosphaeraceae bacterium]
MAGAFVLILLLTTRDARAQWGHGGWGWGGWDTAQIKAFPVKTFPNDPGFYAMGARIYRYDPRLNPDLVAKYNGQVANTTWNFCQFGPFTKEQAEQLRKRSSKAKDAHNSYLDLRMRRQNPTTAQVENGGALNLAVADLSDPKLGDLASKAAKVPVAASLIAEVPFTTASERVTLMLDELRAAFKWRQVFPAERFAEVRRTFDELVTRLQNEDQAGDISDKTLTEAQEFVSALRAKLKAQPLENPDDQTEAMKFVTTSSALVGLLRKPDIRPAISALRKLKDTSLGNLLGFLHAYNLRFGPATTPTERAAYHQLFAILDKTRNDVLAEVKPGGMPTADADPRHVADFFFDSLDMNKRKSENLSGAIDFLDSLDMNKRKSGNLSGAIDFPNPK